MVPTLSGETSSVSLPLWRGYQTLWAAGCLSVLIFASYSNSFANPFLFDDHSLITENVLIREWRFLPQFFSRGLLLGSGGATDFYRPLQSLSYMLDYQLWENQGRAK